MHPQPRLHGGVFLLAIRCNVLHERADHLSDDRARWRPETLEGKMGNKQEAPAAKPAWVAMYRDMDSSAFYMDARGNLLGTVVPAFGGGWLDRHHPRQQFGRLPRQGHREDLCRKRLREALTVPGAARLCFPAAARLWFQERGGRKTAA